MRLLLVEDDNLLGSSLKKALEKHSYGVDWVQDGESGFNMLSDSSFGLAILDVNLPKMSGMELLKRARANKISTPVLLLTANDKGADKVQGLDSGADDYLTKPFDLDELLARVRALTRRGEGRIQTILKSGNVELDPAAQIAKKSGVAVTLTSKEFRVLKLLIERAGKYVTKSDIEYTLYSSENAAESNTTEVTIYALRKKLGSEFIKSMRGVGYMVEA